MALLHSTWLYRGSTWLYFTLHDSTMALLDFILDSTLLYHGSTWFYTPLHYSTMALLDSTWLYMTLPWLYFTLLCSTSLYHGSTWLYLTLHESTMALSGLAGNACSVSIARLSSKVFEFFCSSFPWNCHWSIARLYPTSSSLWIMLIMRWLPMLQLATWLHVCISDLFL